MNLETLIRCLIDHYEWNSEYEKLHELAALLRKLSTEIEATAPFSKDFRHGTEGELEG